MEDDHVIPLAPALSGVDSREEVVLINLAGWIARYKMMGLKIDEVSPFVLELLDSGILAQLEPSLAGLSAGYCGSDEEYERYEFNVQIDDFVEIDNEKVQDWAVLHFVFKSKKCLMHVECCNQSGGDRLNRAMKLLFDTIDVRPLTEEDSCREITWEEADEIILKYLGYLNGSNIPSVPEKNF